MTNYIIKNGDGLYWGGPNRNWVVRKHNVDTYDTAALAFDYLDSLLYPSLKAGGASKALHN